MVWSELVTNHEATIRLSFFIGILCVMGLWELLAPARKPVIAKATRWFNNLGLVVLDTILLRFLFPAAAVGLAVIAQEQNAGLLNNVELPLIATTLIAIVLLDLVIYLQHVMFHALPILWRLHQVHHADLDYDVTTGTRFHPIEIVISMFVKAGAIFLIGPPVVAVILFEIVLNACAMFNHGNVRLPLWLDKIIRVIIVTPDMHRVHHSTIINEANSNFGFSLSIWDKLFGTYRAQPKLGHDDMEIGVSYAKDPKQVTWISGLLTMPFRSNKGNYDLSHRKVEKSVSNKTNTESRATS
ncbi:sterol desaturase family protein [Sessilibacter corallicola]|uniref:sterol desaturase family protein n=1 Tax=Sessilibacter corallicola TaxID=2904075 RepID=UPI001E3FF919|nr:sterol desaturase family protein [Sessilibacter corallicola]MCE2029441.1 sterol desaturase family protein [Sessilibacter corallicola]